MEQEEEGGDNNQCEEVGEEEEEQFEREMRLDGTKGGEPSDKKCLRKRGVGSLELIVPHRLSSSFDLD